MNEEEELKKNIRASVEKGFKIAIAKAIFDDIDIFLANHPDWDWKNSDVERWKELKEKWLE